MSLAKMLAQRRTVRESSRAEVLMISTGKISGASHQTGPAKCLRYPPTPWWRMPCQLKYRKVRMAQARGTLTFPVGEAKKGQAPGRLLRSTKIEIEPTKAMYSVAR